MDNNVCLLYQTPYTVEKHQPKDLVLTSDCLKKWLFVDLERGEVWTYDPTYMKFRKPNKHQLEAFDRLTKEKPYLP